MNSETFAQEELSLSFSTANHQTVVLQNGFFMIKPFGKDKLAALTFDRRQIIVYEEDFQEFSRHISSSGRVELHDQSQPEFDNFVCIGKSNKMLITNSIEEILLVQLLKGRSRVLWRCPFTKSGISNLIYLERNLFLTTDHKEKIRIWNSSSLGQISVINCQKNGPFVNTSAFDKKRKFVAVSFALDTIILFYHIYKKSKMIKIDLQRRGLMRNHFFFHNDIFVAGLTLSEIGLWKITQNNEYEYIGNVKTEGCLTKDLIYSEQLGLLASIKKSIRIFCSKSGSLKDSIDLSPYDPGKIFVTQTNKYLVVQHVAGISVKILKPIAK
jgi:WD40 repeat protein